MNKIDLLQGKQITKLAIAVSVVGAIVGILVYIDQKRHNKQQQDIFQLEKEIKTLELEKLKKSI